MDRNGNSYTIIYASVMVIVVAALLSAVAMSLEPTQARNREIEKKQNILASVNIESTTKNAEELYAKNIIKSYIVDSNGNVKEGGDAFDIDLKKEKAVPVDKRDLPVFECQTDKGIKYIFPLLGTGLWGPIWGYISLDDDMNTIYGAFFDDEGETPGLGAEIATRKFQLQFNGKKLFDNSGKFVSITVAKSNEKAPEEHKVDAVSGGTITSKGLQKMVHDDFSEYLQFIKKKKS